MYLLRPLKEHDIRALERFALKATAGITNLPADRDFLQKRIEKSLESFSKEKETPKNEYYGFALDNVETGETIGTSGIFSRIGVGSPHFHYKIESKAHEEWKEEVLSLHSYENGPTEICSLYLMPSQRSGGIGRLLSLGRFLFMAEQQARFTEVIVAEMRGVSENCISCPFWDATGRHFLEINFCEAIEKFNSDPLLFTEALPKQPIHLALLPHGAKEAIGKPHPHTAPAMRLLEKEGFQPNGELDIFDAGPTIECPLQEIRSIKQSKRLTVSTVANTPPTSQQLIISNCEIDFRATFGNLSVDDRGATISSSTAALLNVKEGDSIRFVSI